MGKYYERTETFLLIERVINQLYAQRKDYIPRDVIVQAILSDTVGIKIAEIAWQRFQQLNIHLPPTKWYYSSKEKLVGNMVDWFSAEYKKGDEELVTKFKREERYGKAAYRPINGVASVNNYAAATPKLGKEAKFSIAVPVKHKSIVDSNTVVANEFTKRSMIIGLERDIQQVIRGNIERIEAGMIITDGGREQSIGNHWIDITAEDKGGRPVVIELKIGKAEAAAVGQTLHYMDLVEEKTKKETRGILIAEDFADDTVRIARMSRGLELLSYKVDISFDRVKLR